MATDFSMHLHWEVRSLSPFFVSSPTSVDWWLLQPVWCSWGDAIGLLRLQLPPYSLGTFALGASMRGVWLSYKGMSGRSHVSFPDQLSLSFRTVDPVLTARVKKPFWKCIFWPVSQVPSSHTSHCSWGSNRQWSREEEPSPLCPFWTANPWNPRAYSNGCCLTPSSSGMAGYVAIENCSGGMGIYYTNINPQTSLATDGSTFSTSDSLGYFIKGSSRMKLRMAWDQSVRKV